MSDLIDRQAVIDLLKQMRKDGDMVPWEGKAVFARIRKLPTIQPETPCYLGSPCEYQNPDVVITQTDFAAGEWIVHLYKVGVNRCECDACHARCDIVYPYCPYCGEKKEGKRYANN